MLANVFPVQQLNGLARRAKKSDDFKSVRHPLIPEEEANGWTIVKRNRGTTRLKKPKRHNVLLEDRVWTVLHRMGFTHLSGEGGAQLILDPKDLKSPPTSWILWHSTTR